MARYFERLAKRTGLPAGESGRAPPAQDDIEEVHEETFAAAPAASSQTVAQTVATPETRGMSELNADAAIAPPSAPIERPPTVTNTIPVVQRKQQSHEPSPAAAALPPPPPQMPAPPAPATAGVAGPAHTPASREAVPTAIAPRAAAIDASREPAAERPRLHAQPLETRAAATPPRLRTRPDTPAPSIRAPGRDVSLDNGDERPAQAAAMHATPAPPRARSIAAPPAAPLSVVPAVERDGARVHIGRIDIAIHAPPPAPAPPPVLAAPRAAPERSREPAFSPSRHYLRG